MPTNIISDHPWRRIYIGQVKKDDGEYYPCWIFFGKDQLGKEKKNMLYHEPAHGYPVSLDLTADLIEKTIPRELIGGMLFWEKAERLAESTWGERKTCGQLKKEQQAWIGNKQKVDADEQNQEVDTDGHGQAFFEKRWRESFEIEVSRLTRENQLRWQRPTSELRHARSRRLAKDFLAIVHPSEYIIDESNFQTSVFDVHEPIDAVLPYAGYHMRKDYMELRIGLVEFYQGSVHFDCWLVVDSGACATIHAQEYYGNGALQESEREDVLPFEDLAYLLYLFQCRFESAETQLISRNAEKRAAYLATYPKDRFQGRKN